MKFKACIEEMWVGEVQYYWCSWPVEIPEDLIDGVSSTEEDARKSIYNNALAYRIALKPFREEWEFEI